MPPQQAETLLDVIHDGGDFGAHDGGSVMCFVGVACKNATAECKARRRAFVDIDQKRPPRPVCAASRARVDMAFFGCCTATSAPITA